MITLCLTVSVNWYRESRYRSCCWANTTYLSTTIWTHLSDSRSGRLSSRSLYFHPAPLHSTFVGRGHLQEVNLSISHLLRCVTQESPQIPEFGIHPCSAIYWTCRIRLSSFACVGNVFAKFCRQPVRQNPLPLVDSKSTDTSLPLPRRCIASIRMPTLFRYINVNQHSMYEYESTKTSWYFFIPLQIGYRGALQSIHQSHSSTKDTIISENLPFP